MLFFFAATALIPVGLACSCTRASEHERTYHTCCSSRELIVRQLQPHSVLLPWCIIPHHAIVHC